MAAAPVGGTGAAIDACERAARHAVDELAFEDAAALYERGLALAERLLEALEPARHAGLLIALGETRQRGGDSDGAREAFARAANLARTSGLPTELAQAALGFGAIVVKPGETDQTLVALLEQSLALVPEAAPPCARSCSRASPASFTSKRNRTAARAGGRSCCPCRAVRRTGRPGFCPARVARGSRGARHRRGSAEVSAEIVELARESGDTELELSGWVLAATDMLELGRPGAAAERLDEAEVLAARLRQPALTWRVLLVRGTLASLAGRFDEAERTIAEAYSVGRRAVGRGAFRYWVLQRHELMYLRGGDERLEADERLLAEEAPDVWGAGLLHLLAIRGRGDEARAGFEQLAANDFGGPIDDMAALPVLSRCAEICALLGDTERAELIYERLLPHADRWLGVLGSAFAGTVHARLGGLAATMGHNERAAEHLEAAVEAHREAGAAPITALAEADLAGVLRTLGDSRRADELRGHALLTARALGMKPLVERLEAEPPPVTPAPRAGARLELEGEYWLIDYAATQVRVRDRKGIGYLARLLERPHVEIPALELASGQATPPAGDAGAMLDDEAKRAYRRRLDELRAEIEEAEELERPRARRARFRRARVPDRRAGARGGPRRPRSARGLQRRTRPGERDPGDPLGDRGDRGAAPGTGRASVGLGQDRRVLPLRARRGPRGVLAGTRRAHPAVVGSCHLPLPASSRPSRQSVAASSCRHAGGASSLRGQRPQSAPRPGSNGSARSRSAARRPGGSCAACGCRRRASTSSPGIPSSAAVQIAAGGASAPTGWSGWSCAWRASIGARTRPLRGWRSAT